MSRVTRSTRASLTDENSTRNTRYTRGALKSNAGALKVSKAGNTRKAPGRAALGDISNQCKNVEQEENRMNKKKRVLRPRDNALKTKEVQQQVTVSHVAAVKAKASKPAKVSKPVAHIEDRSLDRMIDDVDMREDENDPATLSLEDSVENLHLSNEQKEKERNPTMEYLDNIITYFRNIETKRQPSCTYMSRQQDINAKMREILIDWLVEVHLKFKLRIETLYLTVSIIDRFLERRAVSRTKLQLVGCTAMLIASKYEEIYAPEVRDFVYISDKAYTRDQILAMEAIMLNTLEFNLTVPTSLRFAERYMKLVPSPDPKMEMMVHYLMELTLQEYKFLKYNPSLVASSAIYLAQKMLTGNVSWNRSLEHITQYNHSSLNNCVRDLYAVITKQNVKYRAVRKKYSQSRFMEVATIMPCEPVEQC